MRFKGAGLRGSLFFVKQSKFWVSFFSSCMYELLPPVQYSTYGTDKAMMRIRYGNDADPTFFLQNRFDPPKFPTTTTNNKNNNKNNTFLSLICWLRGCATDKKDLAKKNCQTQMACPLNANDMSFKCQ